MKVLAAVLTIVCSMIQVIGLRAEAAEPSSAGQKASLAATVSAGLGCPISNINEQQTALTLAAAGLNLLNSSQFEQAESKLRAALSLAPDLVSAHCNLGLLLNKTGRASEAITHLEYARKAAPDAPAPLVNLAASYQLCGKLDQAISLYSEYLSQFPQVQDHAVIKDIVSHLRSESEQQASANTGSAPALCWQKKQLKVFIHSEGSIAASTPSFSQESQEAFLSWSSSGTLSFEFVNEAKQADIECFWTDDSSNLASVAEGGETILRHIGQTITHAKITLLTKHVGSENAISEKETKTLCLHEIGHALGLMHHSVCPSDVMYCTLNSLGSPSQHDFIALQSLYSYN